MELETGRERRSETQKEREIERWTETQKMKDGEREAKS